MITSKISLTEFEDDGLVLVCKSLNELELEGWTLRFNPKNLMLKKYFSLEVRVYNKEELTKSEKQLLSILKDEIRFYVI
jgi:hypothetical protein